MQINAQSEALQVICSIFVHLFASNDNYTMGAVYGYLLIVGFIRPVKPDQRVVCVNCADVFQILRPLCQAIEVHEPQCEVLVPDELTWSV